MIIRFRCWSWNICSERRRHSASWVWNLPFSPPAYMKSPPPLEMSMLTRMSFWDCALLVYIVFYVFISISLSIYIYMSVSIKINIFSHLFCKKHISWFYFLFSVMMKYGGGADSFNTRAAQNCIMLFFCCLFKKIFNLINCSQFVT